MDIKGILQKYDIDAEEINRVNSPFFHDIIKSGKELDEGLVPIIWHVLFDVFKKNIDIGNYNDAYVSNVYRYVIGLCKEENISILKKEEKVFRARIIDLDDLNGGLKGICEQKGNLIGYDWINSKEPPIGLSPAGRANSKYSSYFYCSENGNTAASEVKPSIAEYISLARFKVKNDLRLVKLTGEFDRHSPENKSKEAFFEQLLIRYFSHPVKDSKNYKFTQFISDEIRKCGVDGICYKSYFTNSYNYVIFNCSTNNLGFENSRILKLQSQQLNFIDFTLEKVLQTHCEQTYEVEKIRAEKRTIINNINNRKLISEYIESEDNKNER